VIELINYEISAKDEGCCQKSKDVASKDLSPKMFPDKIYKSVQQKGEDATGMTCECGVFGAIACGDYPTQVSKKLLREMSLNSGLQKAKIGL